MASDLAPRHRHAGVGADLRSACGPWPVTRALRKRPLAPCGEPLSVGRGDLRRLALLARSPNFGLGAVSRTTLVVSAGARLGSCGLATRLAGRVLSHLSVDGRLFVAAPQVSILGGGLALGGTLAAHRPLAQQTTAPPRCASGRRNIDPPGRLGRCGLPLRSEARMETGAGRAGRDQVVATK